MCGPSMAEGTRLQVRPEIALPRRKSHENASERRHKIRAARGARVVQERARRHRGIQWAHQPPDADQLAVHAGGLRSGAAEPQRAHSGGAVDSGRHPFDFPGAAGDHARPPAGAHRQPPRPPAEPARLRCGACACANKPGSDGQQPVRDLDTIRSFLSGAGPTRCSICPGFRSTSPSASRSTP